MPILIKNRDQYAQIVLDRVTSKLEAMQKGIISDMKSVLSALISIEYLYEIRDYIDQLILNWKDEEVELEDEDIDK